MSQTTKIFLGPPGTGKSTRLLDVMEKELSGGVNPDKIAFCSFTKKAVEEAASRASSRFNYDRKDLKYFRTIHSMAFYSMGLKKDRVMGFKDYKKIGDHLGLKFTGKFDGSSEVGGSVIGNSGDKYMFIDSFSRARHLSPRDVWDSLNHDSLNWWEYQRYAATVSDYKEENGLCDFSDMLLQGARPVDIEVLIVDEAQDLSTAQWKFLAETFQSAKRIYVGGDDDQAIFEWSGADVSHFIDLKGEVITLGQSWRIPKKVHSLAMDITSKIKTRKDKHYNPKENIGHVEYWNSVDHVDLSTGTWLLLVRNSYLLDEVAVSTKAKGYNYTLKGRNSVPKADVKAIQLWERRRKGHILSESEKDLVAEYTNYEGKDKIWHEAFTKMSVEAREYCVSLLRRGESLTKEPRITISTIHGSKGGEADNVVLLTDTAYSTWQASNLNPDAEHRVWYVGATRCKESLHIIMPRGRYSYSL